MTRLLRPVAVAVLAWGSLMAPAPHAVAARQVVDIAHRGSSARAPENTVISVRRAVAQHARFVEIDVQRSADGRLVVVHDTTLSRTTNVEQVFPSRAPWAVGAFTLGEMRRLDAGSWFSGKYAGARIPTLRQVLDAVGTNSGLLLELKNPDRYPGIEADVNQVLRSVGGYVPAAVASGRLVVQSFDRRSLRRFHSLAPDIPVGLLYHRRPSQPGLNGASRWVDEINVDRRATSRGLVKAAHRRGMEINVFTVNSRDLMRRYIRLGVDGIVTDKPRVLKDLAGG
ncbi:MAG TPA: glycerophosphodiester phosphodiesterase family protein [Nocardioidaceae bacterium]|nr:glycerophosphodiester phosphodiesterase family protein [Nocardioidaceae bacterium]